MAAKRVRAAPKKSSCSRPPGRGGTWTSRLHHYLRNLQDDYRPANHPFPRTPEQFADEASQQIFNGDHVLRILDGKPGPWLDEKDVERWGMPPRLEQVRNQIRRFRDEAVVVRDARAWMATQNKRVGLTKTVVKSLPFFFESERQQILDILDKQKIPLRPVTLKAPGMGITRGPDIEETKQGYLTPLGNHLLSYLKQTAAATTEKERCAVVATILHFALEGAFPRGARGTALVKQRSYRSL